MGRDSKIEWTRHTQNFWVGCEKVSAACDFCYAERWAARSGHPELWKGERRRTGVPIWQQPYKWDNEARKLGERHRVFTNSLADFFDNQISTQWRADAWAVMRETPNLDWLVLTKRPQNIRKMLPVDWGDGYPNVWLGCTAEDQEQWDLRLPWLCSVSARHHFVSVEPMLGDINPGNAFDATPSDWPFQPVDWVICGGESGGNARYMKPEWVRALMQVCELAGVPFFMKQMTKKAPIPDDLLRRQFPS